MLSICNRHFIGIGRLVMYFIDSEPIASTNRFECGEQMPSAKQLETTIEITDTTAPITIRTIHKVRSVLLINAKPTIVIAIPMMKHIMSIKLANI
ncbi:unnamed protein product [Adineta ricciae]|uniref:Uncharacterized protein n=1 Tax=Adineta ricciae TaxID=249248 RepID=A0A813XMN9_ADIRI|nr:unnamed protein product [Adineta ricciae]